MIQVYNTIEFVVFNYFISMRSDLLSIMDPMMLASVYNDSTYVEAGNEEEEQLDINNYSTKKGPKLHINKI